MRRSSIYGDGMLRVTLGAIGVLLVFHLLGQYSVRIIGTDNIFVDELVWRFNVDLELNVPTWYASFLAGLASLIAFFVVAQNRVQNIPKAIVYTWMLIAATLLFIAIDETAALHELVLQTVHILADLGEGQSYKGNAWLLLLPIVVGAMGIGLKAVYHNLPGPTFRNLVIAVAVYVFGALVVEYVSIPVGDDTHVYNFLLTPIEEGLEMLGVWLVLRAIIMHIRTEMPATDKKIRALWQ
ncbi:hypothetical protein BH23PAT2_BH23PAT2_04870 [soil metagenome]